MAKDFRANQIETSKIILSGGIAPSGVGCLIYSGSVATNRAGGIPAAMLDDVGTDVDLFISGNIGSKSSTGGTVLLGGDLVTSGVLYVHGTKDLPGTTVSAAIVLDANPESAIVWDSSVDSNYPDAMIYETSNDLYVSASDHLRLEAPGSVFIKAGDVTQVEFKGDASPKYVVFNGTNADSDFYIGNQTHDSVFFVDASEASFVSIDKKTSESIPGADVNFFVSGAIDSKDGSLRSVSLFGGDVVVSGTLYAERQVIEVDSVADGDFYVTGNMFVKPDVDSTSAVEFFNAAETSQFKVDTSNERVIINDDQGVVELIVKGRLSQGDLLTVDPQNDTVKIDGGYQDNSSIFEIVGNDQAGDVERKLVVDPLEVLVNPDGVNNVNFRVRTNSKSHAIATDPVNNIVLIMSGGNSNSFDEAKASDVLFYVSGAVGKRGTSTRSTSVFGGDLVTSGTLNSFYGANINIGGSGIFPNSNFIVSSPLGTAFSIFNSPADVDGSDPAVYVNSDNANIDFVVNTGPNNKKAVYVDAEREYIAFMSGGFTDSKASPNVRGMSDTNFFVSGAIGARGGATRSISVFGGDVVISGSLTDGDGNPITGGGSGESGDAVGWFSGSSAIHGDLGIQPDWISTSGSLAVSGALYVDGGVVFNDPGSAVDFRVASDNNANMLVVKGSTDRVGIGTVASPQATLHLKELAPTFRIQRSNNSNNSTLEFVGQAGSTANMVHLAESNDLVFSTHDGVDQEEILRLGSHWTSDVRQIILLSGSAMAPASMQPKESADINFFVSGAIGSKGTTERGTSVFGGDVVHSGSVAILDPGGSDENLRIIRGNSGNNYIVFENADEGDVGQIYANTANLFIRAVAGDAIFRAGTTNVVRMTSAGQVGLGNDVTPTHTLHVSGTVDKGFRVDTGNKEFAFEVIGEQVLILSGGGATSIDEAKNNNQIKFYVSGSKGSADGTPQSEGLSLFGGDLVVSGNMTVDPGGTARKIILGPNKSENYIKTVGPIPDGIGGLGTDISGVVFRTGFDISESGGLPPNDINFFASGSIDSRGTTPTQKSERGTALFGGDVVISGSLRARQLHYTTHKYVEATSDAGYLQFDTNGFTKPVPGSSTKFVVPYSGRLVKVVYRSENDPGSTDISFHKSAAGALQINTTATETQTITGGATNTTYTSNYTSAAVFDSGDIVGIKVNPTNAPGEVVVTTVWEFDTYLD